MKIERESTLGAAGGAAPTGAAAAQRRTEVGAHGAPEEAAQGATAQGATARPAATVALSARSRELHEALRVARAADDVRHDVVREIKAQVDNGTYSVDPAAIASGMLDRRA